MNPPEREITKPLVNWPNYKVTTLGRVYSIPRGRYLSPIKCNGYLVVKLYKFGEFKTSMISTLVLETFVGPCPKGFTAKHLNGDNADNRLINLEWQQRKTSAQPIAPRDRTAAFDAFDQATDKPGGLSKHWPLKEIVRCFPSVKSAKQAKQLVQDYKDIT